jgi:hypothetical protein
MQKRQHTNGYHIEWTKNNKEKRSVVVSEERIPVIQSHESTYSTLDEPEITASNDLEIKPAKKFGLANAVEALMRLYYPPKDSCDRIIDKEGDEILVKVTEIDIDVIKYKNCDHLDGPTYSIPRTSVLMIEYSNGKREVIKALKSEPKAEPDYSNLDNVYNDNKTGRTAKRLEGLGLAGFIFSIVLATIWWFLSWAVGFGGVLGIIFGSIGIHRVRKNRDTKWGKGFAITSLILGMIMVIVSLIFLIIL